MPAKRKRPYTGDYHQIKAIVFKVLMDKPAGQYSLESNGLNPEHSSFKLIEHNGVRSLLFTINNNPHKIVLKLDNRSVSNKLYITCPYCQESKQSLYAVKQAYACRKCLGLHYPSQSERPQERLMRRIRKLRGELWGSNWPEINNMFEDIRKWPKPKFMNWESFNFKRNKIIELEKKYWPIATAQLSRTFSNYNYLIE